MNNKIAQNLIANQGVPRRRRGGRRNRKTTQRGQVALDRIYKQSRDYVIGRVRQRYGGRNGVVNGVSDFVRIARMINTENKYVDTLLDVTANVTTPYNAAINWPAEGTDNNNRTGRSIKVIKFDLLMRFYFSTGTVGTTQSQTFKWFLVRYEKTNNTNSTFATADFLNQDAVTQISTLSLPNTDNAEDFQILISGTKAIVLPYWVSASSVTKSLVEVSHECDFHVEFNGTGATAIVDHNVQLVIVADTGVPTGGTSGCTFSLRMWYVDN